MRLYSLYVILSSRYVKVWLMWLLQLRKYSADRLLIYARLLLIVTSERGGNKARRNERGGANVSIGQQFTRSFWGDSREILERLPLDSGASPRSFAVVPIYYVCNIAICMAPVSSGTTEHRFTGGAETRGMIRGRNRCGAPATVMRRHRHYILCKHLHA